MSERTPEDVANGILRVAVGRTVKAVPTLKAAHIEAWGEKLASPDAAGKPLTAWTTVDAISFGTASVPVMLDLIVAYDTTAALGGREWLAENADPAQLKTALLQMVGNAFPFGDAETITALTVALAAAQSVPASLPSGRSTNGASPRDRPAKHSTRSS